jgi:nicotinate-nucleotide adenylyltransferase
LIKILFGGAFLMEVMEDEILELKKCNSFAIFGGTFDPIHNGHISSAKAIKKLSGVDKILLLPVGIPPHKDSSTVTDPHKRYEMARLAVKGDKDFVLSSMEIDRKGKTYTIDTIRELREILGSEKEFYFIIGADAIHFISTWKDYKQLLRACFFIAVTRPGYDESQLHNEVDFLKENFGCRIVMVEIPAVDISSSQIRENVKNGLSIKGMVCDDVERYIYKNGLYK